MSRVAEEWIEQAGYDLETAEHMLSTGRYLYVIFLCHLAIEKVLKAAVAEVTGQVPPRTHNLIRLAQAAKIDFPDEHAEFLGMINDASVVTRYPENLRATLSRYTATVAHTYLRKAKEITAWLKQRPPLNRSSTDIGNSS